MKTIDEQLPPELSWLADGHVTDEVILAVADGQEAIVPPDAFAHITGCDRCSEHLGLAALRSLEVSEDLLLLAPGAALEPSVAMVVAAEPRTSALAVFSAEAAIKAAPAAQAAPGALASPPRPLPWRVIAPALVVAALSAAPAALELASGWPEIVEMAGRGLFIVLRCGVMLARSAAGTTVWDAAMRTSGTIVALLPWAAAILLALAGLWIARSTSRKAIVEGGV
jgi:hypothetical protein